MRSVAQGAKARFFGASALSCAGRIARNSSVQKKRSVAQGAKTQSILDFYYKFKCPFYQVFSVAATSILASSSLVR